MKAQNIKGLDVQLYKEENLSPFIFGIIEGSSSDAPTALFYGKK